MENPNWKGIEDTWKNAIRSLVRRSEILKRIHGLYISSRIGDTGVIRSFEVRSREAEADVSASYSVTASKIAQLRAVFPELDPRFIDFVVEQEGEYVHPDEIAGAMGEYGLFAHREAILRIFEERWFKCWSPSMFRPEYPDTNSFPWRLLFALLRQGKRLSESIGADFAILSNNEAGFYNWERYWFRIEEGEIWRTNYLAPSVILRGFARRNGVGFVENRRAYQRARNDPHPTIEGNLSMAYDLRDYVLTHFAEQITSH
jgi:hypothetical protein